MTITPLFTSTETPDAWHRVTAPGGYEWWYFDADDAGGEYRIVAIFFQGFVFHPGYLRAYARYRSRPTRHAPPLPADFPCVYFVLYRGDKIVAQFVSQYPTDQFDADADQPRVVIGPNRMWTDADGCLNLKLEGIPWVLTGRGPKFLENQTLSATLRFQPKLAHPAMQRTFFSRSWSGADHQWVLANPLCEVSGTVTLADAATPLRLEFNGGGYHDHNFGTGPIGPGLKRWMWGRVLLDDHVMVFHYAQPKHGPDEIHLLESDAMGSREIAVEGVHANWAGRTATLLRYPEHLSIGPLRLSAPRVVDATPFYLRVAYEASVRGVAATAFCEIAYPHRLRWPVLGRMIEMSIRQCSGTGQS